MTAAAVARRQRLFTLGLVGAGVLAAFLLGRGSSEGAVLSALKELEAEGVQAQVLGRPLVSKRLLYQRLSVEAIDEHRVAVLGTLDFDGMYGAAEVSSLGSERVPFEKDALAWGATEGPAPRLAAVVLALESRRRAIESHDTGALQKLLAPGVDAGELPLVAIEGTEKYSVRRWLIRVEPEGAKVTEEARLEGQTRERPLDERVVRQLELTRIGREFFFKDGVL